MKQAQQGWNFGQTMFYSLALPIVVGAGVAVGVIHHMATKPDVPQKQIVRAEQPVQPVLIIEEKPLDERVLELKPKKDLPLGPDDDYSFLMTDVEFTDVGAVTADQIQNYLGNRGSALAQPVNGKYFSNMVVESAKEYTINPLVLLARAQVEKGALSKTKLSEKQLKELMGYGIPDSGVRQKKTLGFENQISNAARILRKHFDNFNGDSIHVNYETEFVKPDNAASHSLLRYTPHKTDIKLDKVGGGNHLFMDVYKSIKKDVINSKR